MPRKHVVTLLSHVHGVGKTTLAVSLASVLAGERRVRLIEADAHPNDGLGAGAAGEVGSAAASVVSLKETEPLRLAELLDEPYAGLTLVDAPSLGSGDAAGAALERSELVLVPASVS